MTIRTLTREDFDLLAQWPSYPKPYDVFRFSFATLTKSEMDTVFRKRMSQDNNIILVADVETHTSIGYAALQNIDWAQKNAANMGIRIHPSWCGKGIGTRMLKRIGDWWFEHGMHRLTLDVAATNHRAVACYNNAGFKKTGEFWRDAPDLNEVDLTDPNYAYLAGHIRLGEESRQMRFYWMEMTLPNE